MKRLAGLMVLALLGVSACEESTLCRETTGSTFGVSACIPGATLSVDGGRFRCRCNCAVRAAESAVNETEGRLDDVEGLLATARERLKAAKGSKEPSTVAVSVSNWLDRQKVLGLVSADGVATVERLIEDIR